jgi:hypothetical protein
MPDQFVDEGNVFQFVPSASDPDLPSDRLTFSLSGAPPGMNINPATGLMRWLTSEALGPSTNTIIVRVADNGVPSLSATGAVRVIVREVNQPPVLASLESLTINEGFTLLLTNVATDLDVPANMLTFGLAFDAPPGVTLNPTNGLFRWRPTETQGPSTNVIGIVVTDDGSPSLSATQQFTIIVRDYLSDLALALGTTNVLAGETGAVPLSLVANLDLADISFHLRTSEARLANLTLQNASPEVAGTSIVALGPDEHLLQFTLNPALRGSGFRTLAWLGFTAVSHAHSAIVRLDASQLAARQVSGTPVAHSQLTSGRVFVVASEPLLDIHRAPGTWVRLYGIPGGLYALESRATLDLGSWTEVQRVSLTGRFHDFTNVSAGTGSQFFRAVEIAGQAPSLRLSKSQDEVFLLLLDGPVGMAFSVESSTNLGSGGEWAPWLGLTLTNPPAVLQWTNADEARRFFRALRSGGDRGGAGRDPKDGNN